MKLSGLGRIAVVLSFALFGACFLLGTYAQSKPAAKGGYHLIKTIPLPPDPTGAEYGDYITVDADARRIYVSHLSEVVVLNADDYSIVGSIGGFKRSHGIAIAKELGKGFITDGGPNLPPEDNKVVAFDLKTLKITGEVVTKQPDTDAIIYEPVSKHIFTFNGDSENTTIIDPVKMTVIMNLPLGGSVEFPAVDGKGMLYDNNSGKNEVVAVDARTNTIKARWPTAPEGHPVALVMDTKTRRLFSSGRSPQFVTMIDADTGKVIQSHPISGGVDSNAFDPGTGLLFVSTIVGHVHVFHEDSPNKLSVVETLDTTFGARNCQVDPKTHNLIVASPAFERTEPAQDVPKPMPKIKPGNFRVLIYAR